MAQTHLLYLDPPADVQPAVAAVKQACAGWHRTAAWDVPEHPRLSSDVAVPHALTEAQICSFIAGPSQGFWAGVNVTLMLILVVSALYWAFCLYPIPGALIRISDTIRVRIAAKLRGTA